LQAVIEFFASEGIRLVDEKQPKNPRLRYWYLVLEHPQYNLLANLISVLSMLATACFTVMVILESLPSILDPSCSTALSANENNWTLSGSRRNVTFSQRTINEDFCSPELAFFIIETVGQPSEQVPLRSTIRTSALRVNHQNKSGWSF
jgi:hypothetical protein